MRISRTSTAVAEHEPDTSSSAFESDVAGSDPASLVKHAIAGNGWAWERLIEHIDRLDRPDRVGSWLAATARNECLRCLASRKRLVLAPEEVAFDGPATHEPDVDEALLAHERAQIVREAMAHLPQRWQRLLELLMSDPPASYAEISDELGLPIGSIGPTRGRCLARLRVLLSAC